MESIIIIVHIIAAIGITGLVLIQHGKGADMGASFGSGGSQTMFGAGGGGNALTKSTTALAVVFFVTSLSLGMIARQKADFGVIDNSLINNIDQVNAELNLDSTMSDMPVVNTESSQGDLPIVDVSEDLLQQADNAQELIIDAVDQLEDLPVIDIEE